jgi:hypothetical protein
MQSSVMKTASDSLATQGVASFQGDSPAVSRTVPLDVSIRGKEGGAGRTEDASVPIPIDCAGELRSRALRLATPDALRYYRDLMEGTRSALAEGRFAAFRTEALARLAEGA